MRFLKAYAKICLRHSEQDCDGCPFAMEKTGSDSCLKYILKNPDKAQAAIINYVRLDKEKRDEDMD